MYTQTGTKDSWCTHTLSGFVYCNVHTNRYQGQLVYTHTERFPADGNAIEVKLSAVDTPDLFYVQLCANLDR